MRDPIARDLVGRRLFPASRSGSVAGRVVGIDGGQYLS
jgi:hypothetical protein